MKKMRDLYQQFLEVLTDSLIRKVFILFLLIMAIFFLILIWKWSLLPPQIPLYYSLPRGIERLGTPWQILVLPVYAFIFFGINIFIATLVYKTERLAACLLVIIGLIVSLFLLISLLKIIFLVT
jgi:hypothetical protein